MVRKADMIGFKQVYLLLTVMALMIKVINGETCNDDPNAGTNRCDGMKCKFDWQCFTGYCYDDMTVGKDTCSKFNNCASTIFSHYGRCNGV
jgi:hypothetical protein